MSGFEASGVASAVLQVIAFASETASLCKAIYDGQETRNDNVAANASSMSKASEELRIYLATLNGVQDLTDIATKCNSTADKLHEEAERVRRKYAQGNVLRATGAAFKTYWRQSKIQTLEKALQGYQQTMESQAEFSGNTLAHFKGTRF